MLLVLSLSVCHNISLAKNTALGTWPVELSAVCVLQNQGQYSTHMLTNIVL